MERSCAITSTFPTPLPDWSLLMRAPQTDGPWIFNIASGQGVSLNGIVAELEARVGPKIGGSS